MIVRLNCDLLSYKKGSEIDLTKISYKERGYFLKRLRDSKIDRCVEECKGPKRAKKE